MTAPDSVVTLSDEDIELLSGMRQLCHAVQATTEARDAFDTLVDRVRRRLEDLWSQAMSVADANVRAIEIIERQESFNEQLKVQNRELERQNEHIDEALNELRSQARTMPEADADAVTRAETLCSALREVSADQQQLRQVNDELMQRMRGLEEQALAMAEANADAMAMMEEKEHSISELEAHANALEIAKRELEDKTFRDGLTGLYNHRYFSRELAIEFERARRHPRPLSLVFLDIDYFKRINDTFGHEAGNTVLKEIGNLLRSRVRRIDTPASVSGGPFAARYGGEEFVIILPETALEGGVVAAERIRSAVERLDVQFHGQSLRPITISGGVAALADEDTEPAQLTKRADSALYAAKEAGRNRVMTDADEAAEAEGR